MIKNLQETNVELWLSLMEIQEMLKTLHQDRHNSLIHDHELDFIESMYTKIVYSGRDAEPSEVQSIKKLFQIYMTRKMNHNS